MKKVIRDGKVAVLYSPGYGSGWYSWNTDHPSCLFDPDLVAAVEGGDCEKAASLAIEKYGGSFYTGGADQLCIQWVTEGERFEIWEYDGSERVRILGPADGFVA